jgi:proteasome lid subunit RPN8/RPN11
MQAYLSEHVFWALLVSAIEVYKKECYGLLLGYRGGGRFIVEDGIAVQKAERHATWVKAKDASFRKILSFFQNLPHLDLVGDFHSHPNALPTLSREDVESMRPGDLSIVVEIRDRAKEQYWRYNEDGTLSGSTDEHYLKVAAFTKDRRGKASPVEILCPFAIGFDIKGRALPEDSEPTFKPKRKR